MVDQGDSDQISYSAASDFSEDGGIYSTSSETDDHSNHMKTKPKQEPELAQKENTSVTRAKLVVYGVLIASCVAASILTYVFIRHEETSDFENDFRSAASEISRAVKRGIAADVYAAHAMVISMASYAGSSNLRFPFVTQPDFEWKMKNFRLLTGADFVAFLPLVHKDQTEDWETYAQNNTFWVQDGLTLDYPEGHSINPGPVPKHIHNYVPLDYDPSEDPRDEIDGYLADPIIGLLKDMVTPLWQTGPSPINASIINADFLKDGTYFDQAAACLQDKEYSISKITHTNLGKFFFEYPGDQDRRKLEVNKQDYTVNPHSYILDPVFESQDPQANIVGFFYFAIPWTRLFQNMLPFGQSNIDVVVSDNCGSSFTFNVQGPLGTLKGMGDHHDASLGHITKKMQIVESLNHVHQLCAYSFAAYPTEHMRLSYESKDPYFFACGVAFIFIFTTLVFVLYDFAVQRRQWTVLHAAKKTQMIVSSLFPKNFQDRILRDAEEKVNQETKHPLMHRGNHTKDQLSNFLRGEIPHELDLEQPISGQKTKPIADLFPEATIMFADIVGFTAWSSTREPSQVFQLLEAVYQVFDDLAHRRRVFKVETVGDCYVAVAGLPQPRKDHAVVMARFARDCLSQFISTVKALVVELGPDTEELCVRIGLHSGPVTAGVLRGERARFQLFGDTVNITARMETTGQPNKIHCSHDTAEYLSAVGKAQWLRLRRDKVVAKGKGELQTYWLDASETSSAHSGDCGESNDQYVAGDRDQNYEGEITASVVASVGAAIPTADKYNRLIAWNCEVLVKLLAQTVAHRESQGVEPEPVSEIQKLESQYGSNRYILDEVQEIVRLPKYEADSKKVDPWSFKLNDNSIRQLNDYVQTLGAMYPDIPFHNFEHASHVTMSVMKLLSRIVAPEFTTKTVTEETLHDHTFGITSDPLTQFTVALSALIHDVDHPGVPNAQLVKEHTSLADIYRNKSIAEQNSVGLAWDLLMDQDYSELRRSIYATAAEFKRFRQLVVNIVLATDIMDKDLGALRTQRWNKAFSGESSGDKNDDQNRKATIVMEHLIQASDVAHTMQHWQVYRKWNQRFFKEMYTAWVRGRGEKDPSENWYQGEIGFFNYYIIPLAKKLKDCGVFGVSSDEYFQYAVQNRKQWQAKGQELVAEMLEGFREEGLMPKVEATLLETATSECRAPGCLRRQ